MESTTLDPAIARNFRALGHMIGNTPLLELHCTYRGRPRVLYAKYEQVNMTGSIKDRMALYILRQAYERGEIRPGDMIVEATSGNTGISFAALGAALGHPVTIFMPDWMSPERKLLIASFGATIVPVSKADGGFLGAIARAEELAASTPQVFLPSQFANSANVDAHFTTTGPEIWWQLRLNGRTPDAFVAGVGTGGTVMGVGRFLRARKPDIRVHPLEPSESPTLRTGRKVGSHRIQGISDEFIPAVVKLDELDPVVDASDGDAIRMAQKLARVGLAVGISSGANLIGALRVQNELGADATVVTVFSDSNKKYLSTGLTQEEPARESHYTNDVEFLGYQVFNRVCATCTGDEPLENPPVRLR
jgi:cysteine synthase A